MCSCFTRIISLIESSPNPTPLRPTCTKLMQIILELTRTKCLSRALLTVDEDSHIFTDTANEILEFNKMGLSLKFNQPHNLVRIDL